MLQPDQLLLMIEQRLQALEIPSAPENLYQPILYALGNGGKRIRPFLTLTACNMFDNHPEKAMNIALAIEIFHNFTLLHDDILDKAEIRRGMPTVWKKWNTNIAILSGDAMIITAYTLLAKYKGDVLNNIMKMFNQTALQICEGQQFDMDFETMPVVSEQQYLEMIKLKTSVLLGCCLYCGAIAGNASVANAKQLYEFGNALGMAFQLQDDLLDTYGDEKTFGKKIGGDILAAKKTFLLIHALNTLEPDNKTKLEKIIYNSQIEDSEKIKHVKELFDIAGCYEKTHQKINYYYQMALNHLEKTNLPNDKKQPLAEFASRLMRRNA